MESPRFELHLLLVNTWQIQKSGGFKRAKKQSWDKQDVKNFKKAKLLP